MARILIVDDEANMRRVLSVILREEGYEVTEAASTNEAVALLTSTPFDLVITDQKMSDGDGLSVINAGRDADPTLPVVMLTAFATVELAVEAMREGAFDFLTKPFTPEVVLAVTKRAVERAELLRENRRLKEEVQRLGVSGEILGGSPAMRELKERIALVAPTNSTVLITGETGTGKELVARAIHKGSGRAAQSFVAVNCAAFQEALLESELFGHEKGSFTGADRQRQGLFEAAHKGTLFLDEAGEMSLALQAKLLRVLVDGQVLRVGSTVPRQVDVRVIVATHRDLLQRVTEGSFREDLYYRVAVIPLHMPPLRERREDIPLLLEFLLQQVSRDLKIRPRRIHPDAVERLLHYGFPGNVRELRNMIERACILARGEEIVASDFIMTQTGGSNDSGRADKSSDTVLCDWLESLPETIELRDTLERIEQEILKRALNKACGVQAEAARFLGLSRSDLAYKIKKYEMEDKIPS